MTHPSIRLTLTLALALAACGTRNLPDSSKTAAATEVGAADAPAPAAKPTPVQRKVAIISLQIEGSRVWMSVTNEVGAVDLVDVGQFDGACSDDVDATADPEPVRGAVFAVDCRAADGGVRLRFLHRGPELVLVRAPWGGEEFEVIRNLELPRDARLSFE